MQPAAITDIAEWAIHARNTGWGWAYIWRHPKTWLGAAAWPHLPGARVSNRHTQYKSMDPAGRPSSGLQGQV